MTAVTGCLVTSPWLRAQRSAASARVESSTPTMIPSMAASIGHRTVLPLGPKGPDPRPPIGFPGGPQLFLMALMATVIERLLKGPDDELIGRLAGCRTEVAVLPVNRCVGRHAARGGRSTWRRDVRPYRGPMSADIVDRMPLDGIGLR